MKQHIKSILIIIWRLENTFPWTHRVFCHLNFFFLTVFSEYSWFDPMSTFGSLVQVAERTMNWLMWKCNYFQQSDRPFLSEFIGLIFSLNPRMCPQEIQQVFLCFGRHGHKFDSVQCDVCLSVGAGSRMWPHSGLQSFPRCLWGLQRKQLNLQVLQGPIHPSTQGQW